MICMIGNALFTLAMPFTTFFLTIAAFLTILKHRITIFPLYHYFSSVIIALLLLFVQ